MSRVIALITIITHVAAEVTQKLRQVVVLINHVVLTALRDTSDCAVRLLFKYFSLWHCYQVNLDRLSKLAAAAAAPTATVCYHHSYRVYTIMVPRNAYTQKPLTTFVAVTV